MINMTPTQIQEEISQIREEVKSKVDRLAILELYERTGAVVGSTLIHEDGFEFQVEKIRTLDNGIKLIGTMTTPNYRIQEKDVCLWKLKGEGDD